MSVAFDTWPITTDAHFIDWGRSVWERLITWANAADELNDLCLRRKGQQGSWSRHSAAKYFRGLGFPKPGQPPPAVHEQSIKAREFCRVVERTMQAMADEGKDPKDLWETISIIMQARQLIPVRGVLKNGRWTPENARLYFDWALQQTNTPASAAMTLPFFVRFVERIIGANTDAQDIHPDWGKVASALEEENIRKLDFGSTAGMREYIRPWDAKMAEDAFVEAMRIQQHGLGKKLNPKNVPKQFVAKSPTEICTILDSLDPQNNAGPEFWKSSVKYLNRIKIVPADYPESVHSSFQWNARSLEMYYTYHQLAKQVDRDAAEPLVKGVQLNGSFIRIAYNQNVERGGDTGTAFSFEIFRDGVVYPHEVLIPD